MSLSYLERNSSPYGHCLISQERQCQNMQTNEDFGVGLRTPMADSLKTVSVVYFARHQQE